MLRHKNNAVTRTKSLGELRRAQHHHERRHHKGEEPQRDTTVHGIVKKDTVTRAKTLRVL